jgi:hypothetical protein
VHLVGHLSNTETSTSVHLSPMSVFYLSLPSDLFHKFVYGLFHEMDFGSLILRILSNAASNAVFMQ